MPCRVGITTDPDARKVYWDNRVVGLENWRILNTFRTKEAAQTYETAYANKYGCQAHPGAPDISGTWSVYRFDYNRTRS